MTENQKRIGMRNISIYILTGLILMALLLYFILPFEISIAIIISSFLAFIVFILTLVFYRWIFRSGSMKAARFVILSFVLKIIFFGAVFYLIFWLDFVNIMAFIVAFVVFFAIFLNIETFLLKKKILYK